MLGFLNRVSPHEPNLSESHPGDFAKVESRGDSRVDDTTEVLKVE